MGGRGIVRAVLLAATLVAGLGASAAQAQEDHSYYGPRLIEERVRIPAPTGRTLAATVLRPEGQGPYGAVILNHGVSASARERARESSDLLINAAAVFARRGYVVVMPLRRGFGATGGDPDINPGIPCAIEPVARIFDMIGKSIRVPVLMNYAENDLFFSPKVSRQWYERLNASWTDAESALQPAFGKDGHYLFGDTLGVRYWLPTVEGFLAKHGITFARLDSADPDRSPLLALDRVPNIKSDACKGLYRAFLESPGPRAYAVSGDGRCGFAGGLQDARDVAMKQCGSVAKSNCTLYAVDDAVIWKENVA